jgi:hypothetical protein
MCMQVSGVLILISQKGKEEYLRGETNIAETRQTRAVFLWECAGKLRMEVLDIARMEKFLEKSESALERIMLDPTIVQNLPLPENIVPTDFPVLVSCAIYTLLFRY